MASPDTLQRFLFEDNAIRGNLVHLDASFKDIRDRHAYPAPVSRLLGQALVTSVLLSASIKHHDSLIVQIHGDGPVRLLVAQSNSDRGLRGLAQWRGRVAGDDLKTLCGAGRMVITIDPGPGRERYQGMVALTGDTLGESVEDYFRRSEQLETRLWLACDGATAAGMLLQSIPGRRRDADAWDRVSHLGATITPQELLDLSVQEVLHRLFHEEDVRVFESERTTAHCTCSRESIEAVLRGLGHEEVGDILREQGTLEVRCEFCNRPYRFDAVDAEQLFAASAQPNVPLTRH